MEEFVLYETKETLDSIDFVGDITSDEWGFRLVVLIKDDNTTLEYQNGRYVGEDIEWDECEAFDIDVKDLDVTEIFRLANYACKKNKGK